MSIAHDYGAKELSGTINGDGAVRADRLVRERERREITGVSRATAWRLERQGKYPARRQITEALVGWSFLELQSWIEGRPLATGKPAR